MQSTRLEKRCQFLSMSTTPTKGDFRQYEMCLFYKLDLLRCVEFVWPENQDAGRIRRANCSALCPTACVSDCELIGFFTLV